MGKSFPVFVPGSASERNYHNTMKKKSFIQRKFSAMLLTAVVSIAITVLLQMSDIIVAGTMLGEKSLAAINVITPVYSAVIFFANIIAVGVSILFENAVGAFEKEKMKNLYSEGLIFSVLIGLVIAVIVFLGKDFYFDFYDLSSEIRQLSEEYFMYYKYVFILMPLFLYFSNMVYAEGDELICNLSYAANIVGNVGMSVLMCNIWGIRGIGFGSFFGTAISLLVLLLHLFRKSNTLKFRFCINVKEIPEITKFSFLDASAYLYFAIVSVCINKFIILRFGEAYLPVFTVVFSVIELEIMLDGIGEAMKPIVSIYRGEKNASGERKILNFSMKCALVMGICLSLFFFVAAPVLTKTAFGISDPTLYGLSVIAIRILSLRVVFTSILFAISSYYLISNHILLGSFVICLNTAVMPIVAGISFALLFDFNGLWIGYALSPLLSLIVLFACILFRYGRDKIPFLFEKSDTRSFTFDLTLKEGSIIALRDKVEDILTEEKISPKTKREIMLICEDFLLLVAERNKDREISAECSLLIHENVEWILRYDGELVDFSDSDLRITSFRSMFVSSLMEHESDKDYLITTGYNRNVFRFKA